MILLHSMPTTETGGPQLQPCPNCATLLDTSEEEPLAQVHCPICGTGIRVQCAFNNFVLVEALGSGGMGTVYKARDTTLNRLVALKVLRQQFGSDVDYTAQLEHEARITASINHPHVVKVFSFGSDREQFYLAMELVDKGSLDQLMELQVRVAESQTLEVGIQIARGLEAAHLAGLIHRDVKPGNILFADAHTAKIVDFGLALLAEKEAEARGEVWGTPYYVAPEKLNHDPEDFRSDIYSLGGTLFHALAGRPPFEAQSASLVALKHLKSQAVSLQAFAPEVGNETAYVINRMLHKNPDERYASYKELIDHLQYAHAAVLDRATKPRVAKPRVVVENEQTQHVRGLLTLLLLAVLAVLGVLLFVFRDKLLPKNPEATTLAAAPSAAPKRQASEALQTTFDDGRRQLVEGQFDGARASFEEVIEKADGAQPLLNWARLHRGLALLLGRQPTEAARAFAEVQSAGMFSKEPADLKLANFFVETSKLLAMDAPIPGSTDRVYSGKTVEAFSLLAFGVKDWEAGRIEDAVQLLGDFTHSQPPAEFAWISDDKPLAQKFLDQYAPYAAWLTQRKAAATPAELTAALASLRELQPKLKETPQLSDAAKAEEAKLLAEISGSPAPVESAVPAPASTPGQDAGASPIAEAASTPALEKPKNPAEVAAWNAALTAYRADVALYKFAEAAAAVKNASLSESELVSRKSEFLRKANWLVEWKSTLLADVNKAGFPGPVIDARGVRYDAPIRHAADGRFDVQTPYGVVPRGWTDLGAKMLLTMSSSFIKTGAPDAGDRHWLSAIFALETGQLTPALDLAARAATEKPQYGELSPQFFSTGAR